MAITEKPVSTSDVCIFIAQIHGKTRQMHLLGLSMTAQTHGEQTNSLIIPIPGDESRIVMGQDQDTRMALRHLLADLSDTPEPASLASTACVFTVDDGLNTSESMDSSTLESSRIRGFVREFYPGHEIVTVNFSLTQQPSTIDFAVLYTPHDPDAMQMPTLHADGTHITLGEIPVAYNAIATTRTVPTLDSPPQARLQEILLQVRADEVATRRFEGWFTNADTFAATRNVDSCLPEVIFRKPHTGLWHG